MPEPLSTEYFTLKEVKKRLGAAKEYLQLYKTQRTTFLAPADSLHLPVISLQNYDCKNEYNFIKTVDLSDRLIRDCVKQNRAMFADEESFQLFNISEYGDEYYKGLKRLFSVTCFCLFEKINSAKVTCKAVLCLGSLHHAPRVFYRDSRGKFWLEKLPAYIDLY